MYKFFKRLFDICASAFGILILTVPFIIVSIAIKIESKGPVIFKQERVGLNGKHFKIWKFRSMVVNAESKGLQITSKEEKEHEKCIHKSRYRSTLIRCRPRGKSTGGSLPTGNS